METTHIPSGDVQLCVYTWPVDSPRGVVRIAHGMVEHGRRYNALAEYLNEHGYAVVAHDHRGHGNTKGVPRGYFADEHGWDAVIADIQTVGRYAAERFPEKPQFLVGHSMGSFLTRDYIFRYGDELRGAAIIGTGTWAGLVGQIGLNLANLLSMKSPKEPGKLLTSLVFAGFNKGFEQRTDFDWLSRDHAEVDAYMADPDCGFAATNRFFADFLGAVKQCEQYFDLPVVLPVYIASGELDPVGGINAVNDVAAAYRRRGLDVVTHVYPGARHEIFNETNKEEVYQHLVQWLDSRL
ncbi:alpha/beta hydrolase [Corynebacterium freiburgense]|uniref:alpha/beta hydrolase n=1 Tax=Corynebacterium freiburgense TaxID=556548 RepID=UPI0003F6723E|nr:alpha/beta hydrolase [Corynebacterium freiburgense]WJZ02142.1 Phospholipase YtpA [Corynebacterium freiburgense]